MTTLQITRKVTVSLVCAEQLATNQHPAIVACNVEAVPYNAGTYILNFIQTFYGLPGTLRTTG